jgi:hypothetical protein
MNLILRTVTSPYGDTTLGSVLSQQNVDNNFINLKGGLILTASTNNDSLILQKINGEEISVTLPEGPEGPEGAQGIQGVQGLEGPEGPQGVQGPAGPIGPVGPAGLEWQGQWSSENSYVENDAVGYDGASWFCINDVGPSATPPDEDTANWALLASQGAQGPQGVQGPTGPQGPSGVVSYTDGPLNSGTFSQAATFAKLSLNFTRVFVTSPTNNFVGLSSVDLTTGTFYVVQNRSTTTNLIVRPLDNTRFLQPNGFDSDVNFTIKPNSYARFTLTNITGGSDKVFMVEVINPLGVGSQTLQQSFDNGRTMTTGNFNVGVFDSANGISVENTSTLDKVTLETTRLTLTKNSFGLKTTNVLQAVTPTANRTIRFPDADGTLALTSNIPSIKSLEVLITESDILNPSGFSKTLIASVPGKIIIPLSLVIYRKPGGTAYTLPNNVRLNSVIGSSATSIGSTLDNTLTNASTGTRIDSYSTGTLNTSIIAENSIQVYSGTLGFFGVITGGTGDLVAFITYTEISV